MKLNKKLLIIFISIITFFTLFISSVSAYLENSIDLSDVPEIPAKYNEVNANHFFIFRQNRVLYFTFWKGNDAKVDSQGIHPQTSGSIYSYRYDGSASGWTYHTTYGSSEYFTTGNKDFLYSNENMYNTDGSLFFCAPAILPMILEPVELSEPITTTLVSLVPLLIPFLICLIGFWKCWKTLSHILKTA